MYLIADLRETNSQGELRLSPMLKVEKEPTRYAVTKIACALKLRQGWWWYPLGEASSELFAFAIHE